MTETPARPFTVALIQTTSRRDPADNVSDVVPMIVRAAKDGASFVMLPETVTMMEADPAVLRTMAEPLETSRALAALSEAAADCGVWLLIGSMVVEPDDASERVANRSLLIDDQGSVRAHYDKIHMFDVTLESGESYRESTNYRPGEQSMLADTPWGRLGMTVCYDVRFPALYRHLAHEGAVFLSVPSAFTRPTGQAHWEVLLRARAIENGCFVFAPAQCGVHENGRETYGHSLIIDPWGHVLADGGEEPGIVMATIDPARVQQARGQVPSLTHDREFN